MATHPLFGNLRPIPWLLLQALSVVSGILLAFGINAWWADRSENVLKNSLLVIVRNELLQERAFLEDDRKYREAARESAKSLLAAIARGRYDDSEVSLDERLGDLLWIEILPRSGALASLVDGEHMAAIESDPLRRALILRRTLLPATDFISNLEYETNSEVIAPFLARNASLAQISNAKYTRGMPGLEGYAADPASIVAVGDPVDHSPLLANREFSGIVVRKIWNHAIVLSALPPFLEETDRLVKLIDAEIDGTT
jgi:hypothetical protein